MQENILLKKVDTEAYLSVLKEMIQEGNDVSLVITGGSMLPFLAHGRDKILVSPIRGSLKQGDMAFFQRDTGQYVMHRIHRICPGPGEGEERYFFVGDAQTIVEGPIGREQIFGVITAVQRKGKWLRAGDFWWEFFRTVWLHVVPARRVLMNLYSAAIHRENIQA